MTSSIATIFLLALLAGGAVPIVWAQEKVPVPEIASPEAGTGPEAAAPAAPDEMTTQEKLGHLAKELSQIANAYGPDAVALQVGLLVRAMQAGAVDATEVRVVGPSPDAGETFLRIELLSGLIFDEKTSTPVGRAQTLWRDIAAPAIGGLETLTTTPPNLELVVDYGLQDFGTLLEKRADPNERYEHRRMRFEVSEDILLDSVANAEAAAEVLDRCRVFDADRHIEP